MPEFLVTDWRTLVLDAAVKAIVLFLAAAAVVLSWRHASAASRHHVWRLTLCSFLALPLLSAWLPRWQIPFSLPGLPSEGAVLTLLHTSVGSRTPRDLAGVPTQLRWVPALWGDHVRSRTLQTGPRDQRSGLASALRQAPGAPLLPTFALTASVTSPGRHPRPVSPANPQKRLSSGTDRGFNPGAAADFLLWLAGVLVCLTRSLAGLVQLRRIRRRCRPVTAVPVLSLAAQLSREIGLPRPITLLHGLIDGPPAVPMTWGPLGGHPVVLLPTGFAAWPESRQRAVLLHELAHVKRGDWLGQWLANLVCALYWFHPLVWWTARRLRAESEHACDDRVLTGGVKASDYATHLLEVVRTARRSRGLRPAAVYIARGPRIEARLRAILDARRSRRPLPRRASTAALLVAVTLSFPLAAAQVSATAPHPRPMVPAAAPPRPILSGVVDIREVEFRPAVVRVTCVSRREGPALRPVPSMAAPSASLLPARPIDAAGPLAPLPVSAPAPAAHPAPSLAPLADPKISIDASRQEVGPDPQPSPVPDASRPDPRPSPVPFTAADEAGGASLPIQTLVRAVVTTRARVLFTASEAGSPSEEPNLADKDLSGANLAGRDLSGRDLSGKDLSGANLKGARLTGANLSQTNLSGANLTDTDLSHAKMVKADRSGANLTGAHVIGVDLTGADLSGTNLEHAEVADLTLTHADLSGANLHHINLAGRNLSAADFSGANLSHARLPGADLTRADLSGANLGDADLSHARLKNADLSGANLNGTNLDGADLSGANVTGTKLDQANHH